MNVAPSNPVPQNHDVSATRVGPANGATANDEPVDASSSTPTFDAVYTKSLAEERSAADGKTDDTKADAATDGDGRTAAAAGASWRRGAAADATGLDAVRLDAIRLDAAAQQSPATPTTSSSTTTPDAAKGNKAAADKDDDKDVADDSAAQLAVISQWAFVAKPVATADATAVDATAGTAAARVAFDAKAALNATRASTGRDDTTDGDKSPQPGISAEVSAAAPAKSSDKAGELAITAPGIAPSSDAAALATTSATAAISNLFATRMATADATTMAATTAATTPATPATVREAVGSSGWSHEVGQVVLRMAANDLQSASLRLNPEHLGPLDVQVRVDNGVTHVAFDAAHADTRQALEASRTTLDQMFSSQGIKMGDVSVGGGSVDLPARGSPSDGAQADASRREGGNRWNGNDSGVADTNGGTTVTTRIARPIGLVDTFA